MRELKFRVWSEEDREYRSDIKVSDLAIDIDGVPSTIYNDEGDRFDIEQYTGLKDKNNKKIYEGDIVKVARSYGYGFLPKGAKAKIEFDEKELCYKLRGQGEFRLTAKKELEVIGNIHENLELQRTRK